MHAKCSTVSDIKKKLFTSLKAEMAVLWYHKQLKKVAVSPVRQLKTMYSRTTFIHSGEKKETVRKEHANRENVISKVTKKLQTSL